MYRYVFLISLFVFVSCKSHKISDKQTQTRQYKLETTYQKYKGVKYKYGGTTPKGFDCSGFVQRVFDETFNIYLPRTTKAMMKIGKRVSLESLKTGDLVFFHPTKKYYHVGIYMGDGIFIHASTSKGVMKSNLQVKYWRRSFVKARRIL
jgi:cell wall-associated NlpC family hydrolase